MKRATVRDCSGCRDNFYNGNNDLGVARCWCLETATMVKAKDVPTDMRPPYKHIPLVSRPSCYRAKGYVRVKPEALDSAGFWRSL